MVRTDSSKGGIRRRKGKRGVTYTASLRRTGQPSLYATFDTKRAADEWLTEQKKKSYDGLLSVAGKHTLAEAIDEYCEIPSWRVYRNRPKPKELTSYDKKILDWWKARLGSRRLTSLQRDDFTRAQDALMLLKKEKGPGTLSPATVNRRMAAISAVISAAKKRGWVVVNVVQNVETYSEKDNRRERFLSDDERAALEKALSESECPTIELFVTVALYTGARAGELSQLKWRYVDFTDNWITFDKSGTKSGKTRKVPLVGKASEMLKAEQESDRARCRGDNWVFPANRLYDSAYKYNYHWPLIRKAARLVDFKFHDLRHTAATLMINNGVDLKTVSEILGHSDVSVTSNHYAHLMQKTKQEASQKLAAALEPAFA